MIYAGLLQVVRYMYDVTWVYQVMSPAWRESLGLLDGQDRRDPWALQVTETPAHPVKSANNSPRFVSYVLENYHKIVD